MNFLAHSSSRHIHLPDSRGETETIAVLFRKPITHHTTLRHPIADGLTDVEPLEFAVAHRQHPLIVNRAHAVHVHVVLVFGYYQIVHSQAAQVGKQARPRSHAAGKRARDADGVVSSVYRDILIVRDAHSLGTYEA